MIPANENTVLLQDNGTGLHDTKARKHFTSNIKWPIKSAWVLFCFKEVSKLIAKVYEKVSLSSQKVTKTTLMQIKKKTISTDTVSTYKDMCFWIKHLDTLIIAYLQWNILHFTACGYFFSSLESSNTMQAWLASSTVSSWLPSFLNVLTVKLLRKNTQCIRGRWKTPMLLLPEVKNNS